MVFSTWRWGRLCVLITDWRRVQTLCSDRWLEEEGMDTVFWLVIGGGVTSCKLSHLLIQHRTHTHAHAYKTLKTYNERNLLGCSALSVREKECQALIWCIVCNTDLIVVNVELYAFYSEVYLPGFHSVQRKCNTMSSVIFEVIYKASFYSLAFIIFTSTYGGYLFFKL